MESFKITISKDKALKITKAANRLVFIESGISAPKHAVYKNKKKYSRKQKHNG